MQGGHGGRWQLWPKGFQWRDWSRNQTHGRGGEGGHEHTVPFPELSWEARRRGGDVR